MAEQQKMTILSNEIVRRLSNIHQEVLREEIEAVLEKFIHQLKNSGYSRKQAKEIVVCGVAGWRRKLKRRQKEGKKQFQTASETLEKRTNEKLLGKTSWYKEKSSKRKQEEEDGKFKYNPPSKRRKGGSSKTSNMANKDKKQGKKIKSPTIQSWPID